VSDLRETLRNEFQNEEYRYAYAQSFLNTKLAAQIKTIREQRLMTQSDVAEKMGTKQSGFSRFEDVNHSTWKTDTLWKIARALGVRLNISFETFSSLVDEKNRFSRDNLARPAFNEDTGFIQRKPVASVAAEADVGATIISEIVDTGDVSFGAAIIASEFNREEATTGGSARVVPIRRTEAVYQSRLAAEGA
jgi:transcriptional regulator with XRE-family HTH domain